MMPYRTACCLSRSLSYSQAVADNRDQIVHDEDDDDRYADVRSSDLHHRSEYQPGAKKNIYLIEEEKEQTKNPRRLLSRWDTQPRFRKLLGNSASMADAPTASPSSQPFTTE